MQYDKPIVSLLRASVIEVAKCLGNPFLSSDSASEKEDEFRIEKKLQRIKCFLESINQDKEVLIVYDDVLHLIKLYENAAALVLDINATLDSLNEELLRGTSEFSDPRRAERI